MPRGWKSPAIAGLFCSEMFDYGIYVTNAGGSGEKRLTVNPAYGRRSGVGSR